VDLKGGLSGLIKQDNRS